MEKTTKNGIEKFNPKTIINKEIQDLEFTFKQAKELIRLQKMEGDFV